MPVVQKYGYGLSEPSGGEDKVNGVVTVYVSRLDLQSAGRRDKLNRLLPRSR